MCFGARDVRLIEALRFANKFSISHESINEEEMNRLKNYFSEAEIIELTTFCGFISASQKFGAIMGLKAGTTYFSLSNENNNN